MFTREQTLQAIVVLEELLNYPTLLGESGICLYASTILRDTYYWTYKDRDRLSTLIESLIHTVPEANTLCHPWISPRGQWSSARKQLALNVIQELRNLYIEAKT